MPGHVRMSSPIIQSLYQLIDAIGEGRLLIPSFQRPLIWPWDRQLELLRSVKDGIPMGAVTIWQTTNHLPWQNQLAGQVLAEPAAGFPRQYLLDGLRRLCTLFAALRNADFGYLPTAAIGYDLEEDVFVEPFDAPSQPHVVPLHALTNSLSLLRFQRQLRGDRAHIWIRRTDELAISFREYNLPVIPIVSNDLTVATRVLHLTHSQDTRIGEADVIHALTWTPKFNLRDALESLRSERLQPLGWGDLDVEVVLEIVKAGSDLDLQEDSVEQVSALLRTDPTALEQAFGHLVRAAELLRDRCGILRWELVPYALQAVLLADALRVAGDRDVHDLLVDWFWITTHGEMLAGLRGDRIRRAIRDLRQTVSDGQLRWSGPGPFRVRPIPPSADFRAVHVKAVALMLARQIKTADADTFGRPDHAPYATLAAYGHDAMFPLVPRHLVHSAPFSSVGNRFLCHPTEALELRERLLSAQLDEHERAAYVVSDASLEAAQRGDWNTFIARRLSAISALEQSFVGEILARHPMVAPHEIG